MNSSDREQLILKHLPFAKSFLKQRLSNITDDHISVAQIGIIKAADEYDPSKGAFTTFAKYKILAELKEWRHHNQLIRIPQKKLDTYSINTTDIVEETVSNYHKPKIPVRKYTGKKKKRWYKGYITRTLNKTGASLEDLVVTNQQFGSDKKCIICDAKFISDENNTCSSECANQLRLQTKRSKLKSKKCPCGNLIYKKKPIYCSLECLRKYDRRRINRKPCEVCNKKHKNPRFCSADCRKLYFSQQKNKVCKQCSKPFKISGKKRQKFCNIVCANRYTSKRRKKNATKSASASF